MDMSLCDPKRELSLLLQELMEQEGLRFKEDLARKIGIPGAQVRAYLRQEQNPRPEAIIKIAKYAGMTLDEMEKRLYRVRVEDIVRVAKSVLDYGDQMEVSRLLELYNDCLLYTSDAADDM
jgi:transcriptional regulator with XRE-family HTH domain